MGLTNEQRLQIIELYYQNSCSVRNVHRALLPFYGRHSRPSEQSIRNIVTKFRTKFTLLDIKPATRSRTVRSEENIAAVSASVTEDREMSIRRRSQQLGLCYSTTWKILRKDLGSGSQFPTFPDNDKLLRLISMRFCPYGHRVHLALGSKNIPYHTIYCNLSEKPEWLLEKSPLGKVPALELPNEDGCPVISDSLAICEYLDEKYPQNPLLSRDPLKKLREKNLMEQFGPVMTALFKLFMMGPVKSPGCVEETEVALQVYEKELETHKMAFFGGDKPGWVDYMIWPWVERLGMVKHVYGDSNDLDYWKLKNLAKWIESMKEDRAVKLFYLDGETHAKHKQVLQYMSC